MSGNRKKDIFLKLIVSIMITVVIIIMPNYKPVEGTSIKLGDINDDGNINLTDLLLMLRHIAAEKSNENKEWLLTKKQIKAGDIIKDEKVNLSDVLALLRYMAAKKSPKVAEEHKDWLELEKEILQPPTTNEKEEQTTPNKQEEPPTTNKQEEPPTTNEKEEQTTPNKQEEQTTPNKQEEQTTPNKQEEQTTPNKQEEQTTPNKQEETTPNKQEEQTTPNKQEEETTPNKQEQQQNLTKKITPSFITSIQIADKKGKKSEVEKTTDKWKYGYGTVQGFTTDGEFFYIVATNEFNKSAAKKANGGLERYAIIEKHVSKIIKINRKTKKITKISGELKIGHGNCLTYKDGKIYIASAGVKKDKNGNGDPGYGKSVLYVVDAKTLKLIDKETKYFETPYQLTSIEWNEERKQFYLGNTNGQIWIFDENLNKVGYWIGLKDPYKKDEDGNPKKLHYTQTFFVDRSSFYMLSWEHTQENPVRRQNFILEYDLNGNYIQRINIFVNKSQMEIEDICMYNGKYYIVSNSYSDGTAKIHSIDLKDTSKYYDICFTDQEKLVTQVKQEDETIGLVKANHTYQKIE